jgi:hypothetical protein
MTDWWGAIEDEVDQGGEPTDDPWADVFTANSGAAEPDAGDVDWGLSELEGSNEETGIPSDDLADNPIHGDLDGGTDLDGDPDGD